ncbi:hypothetical protein HPP92_004496 [Vanilla planifolia]|uniref:Uncharacterized protein n=1 Tax=Vanilla planifolia TaxID=51239 RepID=A0A835RWF9_VANPL|nr:hypothetical protein HPP92_004496 [Vanilla planifolia]
MACLCRAIGYSASPREQSLLLSSRSYGTAGGIYSSGLDQTMPLFDIPSKILCRVVNVELQAEPDTDEVLPRSPCNLNLIKVNSPALILHYLNLKAVQFIPFVKHLLLQTPALMEDSRFLGGMQMNVCPHWICHNIHHGRSWLPKIFMEMNGIFTHFFRGSPISI